MDLDEKKLRPLVQQLSRAASTLDRALFGPPVHPARGVDYEGRQRRHQREAMRALESLRDRLAELRW